METVYVLNMKPPTLLSEGSRISGGAQMPISKDVSGPERWGSVSSHNQPQPGSGRSSRGVSVEDPSAEDRTS